MKIALLGAGYIARWHAQCLRRLPAVTVVAVCDRSRTAAEGLASALGGVEHFTDLDEMLSRTSCDVVHVLTPPPSHAALTQTILAAGRHCLVEKPLSLTRSECESLGELAKAKALRLGVVHNFLMLPAYQRLLDDRAAGRLGAINSLAVDWHLSLPPMRSGPYNQWMLQAPENILYEIGPHLFAFANHLLGRLDDFQVRLAYPARTPGGMTLYQGIQVTASGGETPVVFNLCFLEGLEQRRLRINGVGGAATVDFGSDVYVFEGPDNGDLVTGPLRGRVAAASQLTKAGVVNAFRQFRSANAMSPFGLSLYRAIQTFYADFQRELDPRLSAGLAANIVGSIDQAAVCAKSAATKRQSMQPRAAAAKPNHTEPQAAAPPADDETADALVIGGTGFIGRHLVQRLVADGFRVKVLSRSRGAVIPDPDGLVSVVTGDLASEADLLAAMRGVTTVFHLARATETTWEGYLRNDVEVTRKIGASCIKAGVGRLVYTGTIDSYDASRHDRVITEATGLDTDLEHRNLYARSKAACEKVLEDLARDSGLNLVIARPGIVVGEGGPLQHWGIGMWRASTIVKSWGPGSNVLPLVLVDDVVDGLVLCMTTKNIENQSFNLIGDPLLSASEYIAAVSEAEGVSIQFRKTAITQHFLIDCMKFGAKKLLRVSGTAQRPSYRDWLSRSQISPFSNEKAKRVLGWSPVASKSDFIDRAIVRANLFGHSHNPVPTSAPVGG